MKRYNGMPWVQPAQVGTMPPAEVETTAPARPASFIADVVVPLVQAVVTGALVAGVVTAIAASRGSGNLFALWGGLTLGISAIAWLVLLFDTRRLLWGIERLTGLDLDRDGTKGKPEQERRTIEVHLKQGGTTRIIGADWLGLDDDKLLMLAADLVRGRRLAESDLGRDRVIFSRGINEFRAVRSRLVEAGLICPVNPEAPSQGYTVTRPGRAVFERLAKDSAHTRTHANGARK
jgi:hypothetical protein